MAFTKPPIGALLNLAHPMSRDLIGCWLLGEGGGRRVNDSSVGNNPGLLTNINSSTWPGSHHGGRCLSFGGTNQNASVQSSALLQSPTTSLSIAAWSFVPTSAGSQVSFAALAGKDFVSDPRASPFTSYGIAASAGAANQHYCFVTRSGAATNDIQDSGVAITKGVWVHVCGVMMGTAKFIYINGVLVATNANGVAMAYNNGRFTMGSNSAAQEAFIGYIEGVRVYARALQAFEVEWLVAEPYVGFTQSSYSNIVSIGSAAASLRSNSSLNGLSASGSFFADRIAA